MDLQHYLRTLAKFWLLPFVLLSLALAGVYTYHRLYGGEEAEATVSVLDPLIARPGSYGEAQVGFDAVVRSRLLAERVARRLDTSPDDVQGRLSISVLSSLSPGTFASPLFAVRGKAPTMDEARRLTDVASEEARRTFIEVNTPDPRAIRDSLAGQRTQLDGELRQARDAYYAYVEANDAEDLPALVAQQRELIGTIRAALLQSRADEAVARVYGGFGPIARRTAALQSELTGAREELDELVGLQRRYADLLGAYQSAQGRMAQLEQSEQALIIGQKVPLAAQVKVLDAARPRSQFMWQVLTYSLGALLGAFLGATAIYVLALIRRTATTAEQVAAAFRAPVLVRIASTPQ